MYEQDIENKFFELFPNYELEDKKLQKKNNSIKKLEKKEARDNFD